jgi:hypothetical protein
MEETPEDEEKERKRKEEILGEKESREEREGPSTEAEAY